MTAKTKRRSTSKSRRANTRRRNTKVVVLARKNRRSNPGRHRSMRRNPSIGGVSGAKGVAELILGGVGGVTLGNAVPGFLPATLTSNPLFTAVSVGGIGWGVGLLVGKFFNKNIGDGVAFGALMQAASGLINAYVPGLGLSGMGAFVPAAFNEPDNPILAARMRQQAAIAAAAAPAPAKNGMQGVFSAYGGAY